MSPATAPHPRRWQALIVLAVSLLVVSVGNTILNVALPTIQEELDASSSELQWIVDGYLLLFAGLLLAAGSLGDRFGRRRMLVGGLIVFGAGSVFAALATSSATLIASRALMGVGAAGIMPTTLSIISNIFPADERPKAIAIWAAAAGMGVAIGPLTGGWLIEHVDYSAVFVVNLPAVAACLIGAALLVPESCDPDSPRLDVTGAALSVAMLTALVWALIEAPERGWTDPLILAAFAAGTVLLAAFVAWERRVEHPMLEVSVFRNLRFSAASLSITFVYFALMGVMYFLTTYLQTVLGMSALDAGVQMLPIAAGMIVAARLSVVLTPRVGTKIVVAAGLATVAGSLVLLTGFGIDTGAREISLALATMGAGVGLAMAPATEAIMGSLPAAKAGIGSAMNDVVREVAGTLGIAVLGSLLASAYASGMDGAVADLPPDAAAAATDSVGAAHAIGGEQLVAAADLAFVDAMTTTATIAAVVAIAGALIAAAFLPARAPAAAGGAELPAPAPA
ncbi:MAG TPA: DHA2 family efflux MFS transporter permease subunit [Solirubrobacteraceae bacterium]|nr:DHA2 family efflux MFS transporter permease subunit [Solirubrobacteraceae bacterium]